ncbi:MAG: hypothetical protein KIT87_06865 [Anaerolineae bacterium]|nr:hypothetical protein [Anaerolineae bacterium]
MSATDPPGDTSQEAGRRSAESASMRPRAPAPASVGSGVWTLLSLGLITAAVYLLRLAVPMALRSLINQPLIDLPLALGENVIGAWYYLDTVLLLFGLYYWGYRVVRHDAPLAYWRTRQDDGALDYGLVIALLPVVFAVALLLMFPVTAGDLFVYIFFGRIWAFQGLNPYITSPEMVPSDITFNYTVFREAATVYGALFTHLSALLARLAGDSLIQNVLLFKGAMVLFYGLTALCVYLILKRTRPELAWVGVYLVWWNPLVQFNTAGDGHNDITMLAVVMLALLLAQRGQWSLACAALVLSMSMKWVSLILVPVFVVAALRAWGWRRAPEIFGGLAVGFGLAALLHAPFYAGLGTVLGSVPYIGAAFTTSIATVVRDVLLRVTDQSSAETWARLTAYIVFGLLYLRELTRIREGFDALVYACFQAFFLYLLIGTLWFQPWYVIWLVGIGALLVGTPVAERTILLTFTAMLIHLVTGFGWRLGWFSNLSLLHLTAVAVVFAVPLILWLSERWPAEDKPVEAPAESLP